MIEALDPDVVLMDLEMPGTDGLAALEELARKGLPNKVIVFTVFDTDERILRAVQAGAQGYLLKGAPREEVFPLEHQANWPTYVAPISHRV